jgi:geranylgeranyl transferase type-2 subunit beta
MSLLKEKHIKYIQTLDDHTDSLAYWLTEHLRLSEYI